MDIEELAIAGVKVVTPPQFEDDRGAFSETYNRKTFASAGIDCDFCQDNTSRSIHTGTIRGLHYQAPPFAQAKLVRVLAGSIIDVAVDARKGSPTFGRSVSAQLSAVNRKQIFVPRGFLHGFVTLEPETVVSYKVDNFYDRNSDGAVIWNDPDLAIEWSLGATAPVLSAKDAGAPTWAQFTSPFTYTEDA